MMHPLIQRLYDDYGYPEVTLETHQDFVGQPGITVLFFAGDPKRFRDTTDVAVVLPELVTAFAGVLQPWHILIATFFNSMFNAIQWPAWSAAQTLIVPKEHLGRAGGMVQIGQAASDILAPALAGLLVVTIQVSGVLLIDFVTFL